jgi:hypothetical protein
MLLLDVSLHEELYTVLTQLTSPATAATKERLVRRFLGAGEGLAGLGTGQFGLGDIVAGAELGLPGGKASTRHSLLLLLLLLSLLLLLLGLGLLGLLLGCFVENRGIGKASI